MIHKDKVDNTESLLNRNHLHTVDHKLWFTDNLKTVYNLRADK